MALAISGASVAATDKFSTSASTAPAKDESQVQALYNQREQKRRQLRVANLQVWKSGPTRIPNTLDSNLKKNTAYLKRVKQSIGQDARDQLLKDLPLLNLEKYLQELIQAVSEGLARCTTAKDCFAAAEIVSAFQVRFGGHAFGSPLTNALEQALAPASKNALQSSTAEQKERDEAARVSRQKPLLRVTAELALVEAVGHSQDNTGAPWLLNLLKNLLATDKEHSNVPLVIAILKGLGQSMLSPVAAADVASTLSEKASSMTLGDDVDMNDIEPLNPSIAPLVSSVMQTKFRKLFETYFSTLARRIVKEHQRLQDQDRRNHEAYIRSGEIFEDRQQNYERMTKSFERVRGWGRILSELLNVPMPQLESSASASITAALGVNLDSKSAFERADEEFASDQSPWEDQDTQKFYENLLDIGDIIPHAILAQTTGIAAVPSTAAKVDETDSDEVAEAGAAAAGSASSSPQLDTDPVDEPMNAGPAAQLASLMALLPDMTNRSMIDSAAVDFAFIATKPARRKLVKHLASLPRNRIDLAPYYARLAATLNKYMPDIGAGLTAPLEDEFRYLQRRKNVDLTETRAKNARFISELTKFKITPTHAIFHCFKTCLEDFSGPNIEMLAYLLEGCGRYLLRTEETSAKMRSMLDMLRRKRAATNLDSRQLLMLNNAYYQCNPPKRKAIEQKVREPMELYIRHLVHNVLQKKTVDSVVVQLRKLPWDNPEVSGWLKDVFTRSWKIRYSNIHLLAILVYELDRFHPAFAVEVIDQVLENVRIGTEENIFNHNQRRVATVCYLGELYNYRLINGGIIFEQLWSLATFGHLNGRPWPGQVAPLDAPDDYFRIRLICTLLDTCGVCFDRGSLKKKLDDFLVFFNVYVLCKKQPLPMDVDFMLTETLETLRPGLKFKKSFAEAAVALEEMMDTNRQIKAQAGVHDESDDEDDGRGVARGDGQTANGGEKRRHARNAVNASGSDGSSATSSSSSSTSSGSSSSEDSNASPSGHSGSDSPSEDNDTDEEPEVSRHLQDEELAIRKEADDEFDRELAKMMAEFGSSAAAPASITSANSSTFSRSAHLFTRGGLSSTNASYGHSHSHPHAHPSASGLSEIGLPIKRKPVEQPGDNGAHMNFSLLSKKGSKQVTHEMQVPSTSLIAINTRSKQLKEEAERKQLKQLVLAYERNSENQQNSSGLPPLNTFSRRQTQQQPQQSRDDAATNRGRTGAFAPGDFKIWTSHGF
ncbi:related to NMD2 - Nonsense-mediated mRNA decay protein 2 [Melanopsichium pennsylvanicum]|uniref:Related to NMD2 - Nonsense-mediated mRNA decay protein 2 n=2 Tax=Melanopsichium pennsylvanicum TaxID=63383 RepID=A0AAJ5C6N0_9BASI|nr:related to NMD2-Nonsense-mediated mRNA decay protein 2 [Melanopsichium pennsylvanicum 4]SNX86027.1 related to NMD2 - Nonsense-mediated mRNA decay protein 2 [Melanopsichium pennsylvanicum]